MPIHRFESIYFKSADSDEIGRSPCLSNQNRFSDLFQPIEICVFEPMKIQETTSSKSQTGGLQLFRKSRARLYLQPHRKSYKAVGTIIRMMNKVKKNA